MSMKIVKTIGLLTGAGFALGLVAFCISAAGTVSIQQTLNPFRSCEKGRFILMNREGIWVVSTNGQVGLTRWEGNPRSLDLPLQPGSPVFDATLDSARGIIVLAGHALFHCYFRQERLGFSMQDIGRRAGGYLHIVCQRKDHTLLLRDYDGNIGRFRAGDFKVVYSSKRMTFPNTTLLNVALQDTLGCQGGYEILRYERIRHDRKRPNIQYLLIHIAPSTNKASGSLLCSKLSQRELIMMPAPMVPLGGHWWNYSRGRVKAVLPMCKSEGVRPPRSGRNLYTWAGQKGLIASAPMVSILSPNPSTEHPKPTSRVLLTPTTTKLLLFDKNGFVLGTYDTGHVLGVCEVYFQNGTVYYWRNALSGAMITRVHEARLKQFIPQG